MGGRKPPGTPVGAVLGPRRRFIDNLQSGTAKYSQNGASWRPAVRASLPPATLFKGHPLVLWVVYAVLAVAAVLACIAIFFFVVTQGALKLRAARAGPRDPAGHIYPVYSNRLLIRVVDFQPMISAILLFQYARLVTVVTERLRRLPLGGKDVLITSCAFGNVIPRVVAAARAAGARRVLLTDLIQNELDHAKDKLTTASMAVDCLLDDATASRLADGSVGANVLFFLLHEIPWEQQRAVVSEAARVLAPGGVLFLADFHRPAPWTLRAMSWTYFKVFEPFGLALWGKADPLALLNEIEGVRCERVTVLFGNFQVVIATKTNAAPDTLG